MQKFENENFFFQGKLNILPCSRRHSVFDNDDDEDVNPHTKKKHRQERFSFKKNSRCVLWYIFCMYNGASIVCSQSVSKRSVTDRKIVNLSPIHKTKRKRKMNTHNNKKTECPIFRSNQTKQTKRNEIKIVDISNNQPTNQTKNRCAWWL